MVQDIHTRKWTDSGTIVRVFSPAGTYLEDRFCTLSSLYEVTDDVIFMASHFDRSKHQGDYYSEFDEPLLEELRLLASLALSRERDVGPLPLYPIKESIGYADFLDFHDPGATSKILGDIRNEYEFDLERQWFLGTPPPMFGGPGYEFSGGSDNMELRLRIYRSLKENNYLLMRGLASLISAGKLSRHYDFFEFAIHSLFISMDVSFQIILRNLRNAGIENPNARNAGELMEVTFGEKLSGKNYFEDYYQDRVKALHPSSRFGIYPYVPMMHDDYFALQHGMGQIYQWLILGEPV